MTGTETVVFKKQTAVIERYLASLRAYRVAQDRADAAFLRYFERAQRGERTNSARASHLANEANYRSADLYADEGRLHSLGIDPRAVALAAGLDEDGRPIEGDPS